MTQGDGKRQGTDERSALKLPIPLGLAGSTLNLTVPEDEFRIATIGGRHVMSTGSALARERKKTQGTVLCALGLLTLSDARRLKNRPPRSP